MTKTEKRGEQALAPSRPPDKAALIDRQYLSDFTMGDRSLERRFLQLFLEHANVELTRMARAGVCEFREAAHSLKSSASSIGAWQVLSYLEQISAIEEPILYSRQTELFRELADRIANTVRQINEIMDND